MKKILSLAAALALTGAAAQAVTIGVSAFSPAGYAGLMGSMDEIHATEDFETTLGVGLDGQEMTGGLASAVGQFGTIGSRTGTGGSVIGTGTGFSVRNEGATGSGFGRSNTTPGGEFYLDSNDTQGVRLIANTGDGTMFNRLVFTLTDAADQGAVLEITANDRLGKISSFLSTDLAEQANGTAQMILISFSERVERATIRLFNGDLPDVNDGFGMDDIAIASVPLPAGGLLLLGGLGALALRRRKA